MRDYYISYLILDSGGSIVGNGSIVYQISQPRDDADVAGLTHSIRAACLRRGLINSDDTITVMAWSKMGYR